MLALVVLAGLRRPLLKASMVFIWVAGSGFRRPPSFTNNSLRPPKTGISHPAKDCFETFVTADTAVGSPQICWYKSTALKKLQIWNKTSCFPLYSYNCDLNKHIQALAARWFLNVKDLPQKMGPVRRTGLVVNAEEQPPNASSFHLSRRVTWLCTGPRTRSLQIFYRRKTKRRHTVHKRLCFSTLDGFCPPA